jgi:coenzyme F420-reducing hydrogenase gamma subunit
MAAGNWKAVVTGSDGSSLNWSASVAVQGQQVQITCLGLATVTENGVAHQLRRQFLFVGTATGQACAAKCQQATWTTDGRPVQPTGLPLTMTLTLGNSGRSAQGTIVNSLGKSSQVKMEAQ